jgi:RNA polymerase sigma-70 factor, ECF subfamily
LTSTILEIVSKGTLNSEQFLVEKLKSGDPDSFSFIFSTYFRDMVYFAYSFTHELNAAEDIVQDTFVKLWEDHEKLNVTVSLKSVLMKTIQNKCIDWYRHKKVLNIHSTFIINNSPLYDYDTDNYVLKSELEGVIDNALATLPDNIREAFEMNRYEGLKYQEIAVKLNVSVRTIEVRIGKALDLLRKKLIDFL